MQRSILALTLLGSLPQVWAQPLAEQARYRPDQILVKPNVPVAELAAAHTRLGSQVLKSFPRFGNLQVVKLPAGVSVEEMVDEYQRSGMVEYAEPNYFGALASHNNPNDTRYVSGELWNLNDTSQQNADIAAPDGWHFRTSAQGVVVAVLDTGVRYTHEDLAMNMWRNPDEIPANGQDDDNNGVVDDVHGISVLDLEVSGDPSDDFEQGHGTHVAGIIGAVGNNGLGVVGVAWRVQIMACKWIPQGEPAQVGDAIWAIDYAIDNGAHIINASWVIREYSQALHDAIRTAGNHGIIFVAAAGNDRRDNDDNRGIPYYLYLPPYPASYEVDNIVTVASTTKVNGLASDSCWGLIRVDLGAPGGDEPADPNGILSTGRSSDSAYFWNTGTSMAAPHVSGAFALMKAQSPNESYFQLINRVFSTTDLLSALSGKCQTGGQLNLHRALTSVSSSPRNDSFDNSFEIKIPAVAPPQTAITATGNNVDATSETGEPSHAGASAAKSVWWRWTPASPALVYIKTQGSTFNTRLAVYTGSSVSTLTPVASSSASDGCSWSQVGFNAAGGTTYRIAVDGYNGAVGSIKLTVALETLTPVSTLGFDPSMLQRPDNSHFGLRVVGPPGELVTLDIMGQGVPNWTPRTTLELSPEGVRDYTDTTGSASYRFYRCSSTTSTGPSLKSCNAVGYVDRTMPAGFSMIANPLSWGNNPVSVVLPTMPDATTLQKWDDVNDQWFEPNIFMSGYGWTDPNMTLAPGEGAVIELPTGTTHSFIGEWLQGYLVNPVPSGWSMRASKTPLPGPVASGLGTPILEGDIVMRMVSGTYQAYAFHNGVWTDSAGQQVTEPVISIGESFWIVKPADWYQISSVWP